MAKVYYEERKHEKGTSRAVFATVQYEADGVTPRKGLELVEDTDPRVLAVLAEPEQPISRLDQLEARVTELETQLAAKEGR